MFLNHLIILKNIRNGTYKNIDDVQSFLKEIETNKVCNDLN